jgi:hypothetical protein
VETRTCEITGEKFDVSDREISLCEHFGVPLPDTNRQERLRLLMANRNEWKLYRRKCDFSGDEIISAYPPDSPFKVYKNEVWWGSDWDAMEYGRDFDFNRPFFEQFKELQKDVPRVYQCEDIYYSYWMVHDKDVFDCAATYESTLCYNCIAANKCYQCIMVEKAENCNECYFSHQLRGCDHCLFCTNLANKNYHLFNKPCSKEEFEEAKNKILNGSWKSWKEAMNKYLKIREKAVHRYVHTVNCEDCTGDHTHNCRNCDNCFDSFDSEDCVNGISIDRSKIISNVYSTGWPGCEGVYMSSVIRGSKEIAFCAYTWFSGSMRYCDSCNGCDSCFGCIGLQHKTHCIFNKQYGKEEYEELSGRIIEHMKQAGEWGKFFPPSLSPFGYNDAIASDFFPLNKEEALGMGFNWCDYESEPPSAEKNISADKLPDNIKDIPDDVLNWAIECETCGKLFKMVPQELKFYREFGIPIPRSCSSCRHRVRFNMRNLPKLYSRSCDKCNKDVKSTYSPTRPEKIYCKECFRKEMD